MQLPPLIDLQSDTFTSSSPVPPTPFSLPFLLLMLSDFVFCPETCQILADDLNLIKNVNNKDFSLKIGKYFPLLGLNFNIRQKYLGYIQNTLF